MDVTPDDEFITFIYTYQMLTSVSKAAIIAVSMQGARTFLEATPATVAEAMKEMGSTAQVVF